MHGAAAIPADQSLDADHFRVGDPGHIAVGDLEGTAVDDAIAHRPAEQAVVWVDARQALRQPVLNARDHVGMRRWQRVAHAGSPSTAAALRRMPSGPGRSNGVSPYRRANAAASNSRKSRMSGPAAAARGASSAAGVGRANFTFQGHTSWQTSQPN